METLTAESDPDLTKCVGLSRGVQDGQKAAVASFQGYRESIDTFLSQTYLEVSWIMRERRKERGI